MSRAPPGVGRANGVLTAPSHRFLRLRAGGRGAQGASSTKRPWSLMGAELQAPGCTCSLSPGGGLGGCAQGREVPGQTARGSLSQLSLGRPGGTGRSGEVQVWGGMAGGDAVTGVNEGPRSEEKRNHQVPLVATLALLMCGNHGTPVSSVIHIRVTRKGTLQKC